LIAFARACTSQTPFLPLPSLPAATSLATSSCGNGASTMKKS
jgi:hypothetical protein